MQIRASETQRIEKVLEDAAVKIGAVASSTLTKSGRAMIEALVAGERASVLAELAKGRMRLPQLIRALGSRFEAYHATQLRQLLGHRLARDCRLRRQRPGGRPRRRPR